MEIDENSRAAERGHGTLDDVVELLEAVRKVDGQMGGVVAAGEGCKAALSAYEYLQNSNNL